MISVVLTTLNDERRLGATLGALVPAAVDGLVHEVVIADGGSSDATLAIADDAGAVLIKGGLAAACAAAKEPWLLVLDAGAGLVAGWEPVVHAHMQISPPRAGRIEPVAAKGLVGWLSGLVRPAPVVGLLAPKTMLGGGDETLAGVVQAIGRGRMVRLNVGAVVKS